MNQPRFNGMSNTSCFFHIGSQNVPRSIGKVGVVAVGDLKYIDLLHNVTLLSWAWRLTNVVYLNAQSVTNVGLDMFVALVL